MANSTFQAVRANDLIESVVTDFATELETVLDSDILTVKCPILQPLDERIRDILEARKKKRPKLTVILETEGGFVEVVVRIVDTLRHHYPDCVDFIIPNYAFSAGTVLALSGDDIYMDYFSVLGPIDPQIDGPDGKLIPALGYVERYDKLIERANNGGLSTAEMTLLVEAFDQGLLQMFEHARELSKTLLKQWLPKYKFKDWTTTETAGRPVDDTMRQNRADWIADQLGDTKKWHSHGMGISMAVLRRDINLKVNDFGENDAMNTAIRKYNGLLNDYSSKLGHRVYLHIPGLLTPLDK